MSKDNKPEFDYEGTVEQIRKIQQQNVGKIQALAQAGKGVDPAALANIKIDTFVNMFLDKNAQAAYVLAMEKNLQVALDEGLAQLRQAQLLQGTPSQTLLLPR